MKLGRIYQPSVRAIARGRIFRFPSEDALGARHLQFSLSTHSLPLSSDYAENCLADTRRQSIQSLGAGVFDSTSGALFGRAFWRASVGCQFFKLTAYSPHVIELKLDRMILDISPHNRPGRIFGIPRRGRYWAGGASLAIFKSIHSL